MTLQVIEVPVVAGVPLSQGLVQAIKPVGGSGEVDNLLTRDIEWHKFGDGVADEHVCILDVTPQERPNVVLRGPILGNKVGSNLDVGSIENGAFGSDLLDQGNETRHLRIINLR